MPSALVLSHASIAHELGHLGSWLDVNDYSVTTVARETRVGRAPDADLLIVLGSPTSAAAGHCLPAADAEIDLVARWVESGRPYLGLCFGAQVLARALGGAVIRMPATFRGYVVLDIRAAAPPALAGPWTVWHEDAITAPPAAEVLASLDHADLCFRSGRAWALQPHVEVTPDILERLAIALGTSEEEWQPLVDALHRDADANRARAHELFDAFADDALGR